MFKDSGNYSKQIKTYKIKMYLNANSKKEIKSRKKYLVFIDTNKFLSTYTSINI